MPEPGQRREWQDLNVVSSLRADPRILLVADNDTDAHLTIHYLSLVFPASKIARACDLATALELLESFSPSIVLCDPSLPTSKGTDTIEALIRGAGGLPVVALAGGVEAAEALSAGAQDYIDKAEISEYRVSRVIQHTIARSEATERLHYLTTRDQVTDLANRFALEQGRTRLFTQARHHNYKIGVFVADLREFEQLQQQHTEQTVNTVLRHFGSQFRNCFRDDDLVARLGGGRFVALLALPDQSAYDAVATRVATFAPIAVTVADTDTEPGSITNVKLSAVLSQLCHNGEELDLDTLVSTATE